MRTRRALTALLLPAAALLIATASPAFAGPGPVLGGDGTTGGAGKPKPTKPVSTPNRPTKPGTKVPAPKVDPLVYWTTDGPTEGRPTGLVEMGYPVPDCASNWYSYRTKYERAYPGALGSPVAYEVYCAKPPYVDTTGECSWSVGGSAVGATGNPAVTPKTTQFAEVGTPFANGKRTLAACDDPMTAPFGTVMTDWGHWTLGTHGQRATCTFRLHNGGREEFRGCGTPYQVRPRTFRATLSCQGVEWGVHAQRSFAVTACDPPGGGPDPICGDAVNQQPTYLGGRGRVKRMDDGTYGTAIWATPVPQGITSLRKTTVRLDVDEASTPHRGAGVKADHRSQPFMAREGFALRHVAWAGTPATTWDIAFLAAGSSKAPWTARPTWAFEGDMQVSSPVVTGVDPVTGQPTIESVTRTITVFGECTGQPLLVDIFRARNSN
jgi:hypothetical protein